MYSLGLLLWEIFTSEIPFRTCRTERDMLRVLTSQDLTLRRPDLSKLNWIPQEFSSSLISLIELCWAEEKQSRPSSQDCCSTLSQMLLRAEASYFDIFFSYARKDNDLLCHVMAMLPKLGYRLWYDTMEMGLIMEESMYSGIERSSVFLCCLSSNYAASTNCMKELKRAAEIGKRIIVLWLDEKRYIASSPYWHRTFGITSNYATEIKRMIKVESNLYVNISDVANQFAWKSKDMSEESLTVLWNALKVLFRLLRRAGVYCNVTVAPYLNGYDGKSDWLLKNFKSAGNDVNEFHRQTLLYESSDFTLDEVQEILGEVCSILEKSLDENLVRMALSLVKLFAGRNEETAIVLCRAILDVCESRFGALTFREYAAKGQGTILFLDRLVGYYRTRCDKMRQSYLVDWCKELNDRGQLRGSFLLAECYLHGIGGAPRHNEAVTLFSHAALSGDMASLWRLVDCLQQGIGVKYESILLHREARDYGYAEALYHLGACFLSGSGV